MTKIVATFYKFVKLTDFQEKKDPLLLFCRQNHLKGTIILAKEGINGTISGSRQNINAVINHLRCDPRLKDLKIKKSSSDNFPFDRMKVRLKREIVTLGIPDVDPSEKVGIYVNHHDWNQLICDPEVLVIDTRNNYEFEIGSFQGAINPKTQSFREFPNYVQQNLDPKQHKKVAMFCTGGIRCEKATSYLLDQGFEQVYHLKGGILKYLQEVEPQDSLWNGECFVFDERVAVKHHLEVGKYEMCFGCGHPITEEDKLSSEYEKGVSCPYCFSSLTLEKLERQREKQKQLKLAKKRKK